MTAAAELDLGRSAQPHGPTGRERQPVMVVGLLIVVGLVAACTGGAPAPNSPTGTSATPGGTNQSDERAIRSAIDAINSTAGGPIARQQAELATLVDPALSDAFRQCPPATATLRFEPVYADLRATPGWTAPEGTPAGTVYALPVLIRIYTGDRITGTDLATLHLGVHDGAASITPLCVG